MPIETQSDESKKLTIFTASGELTYREVSDAIKSFYEGTPTQNVLWDLFSGTTANITMDEVRMISLTLERFRKSRKGAKTALVSSSDLTYGQSRMLQKLLEVFGDRHPVELRVFRGREEARLWLSEDR